MHFGRPLTAGLFVVLALTMVATPRAFADTNHKPSVNLDDIIGKDKATPQPANQQSAKDSHSVNLDDIIGKDKAKPQPDNQQSDQVATEGLITETVSAEMFDEIDRTFQRHFKLASGPTPQYLLKQLEPQESVLKHKLKEEFCRYGILAVQYASYGQPKEAMATYRWLEENYKSMLAPNSSFFKEVSSCVGLYLCVTGDYTDAIACLENALQQPNYIKTEQQRVALVITNFGLAHSYHKLGNDDQAFKYLAQGKAFNDINRGVKLGPPPHLVRSGYVQR